MSEQLHVGVPTEGDWDITTIRQKDWCLGAFGNPTAQNLAQFHVIYINAGKYILCPLSPREIWCCLSQNERRG